MNRIQKKKELVILSKNTLPEGQFNYTTPHIKSPGDNNHRLPDFLTHTNSCLPYCQLPTANHQSEKRNVISIPQILPQHISIHLLIVVFILSTNNFFPPFLMLQIPFNRHLNAICELRFWKPS